MSIVSRMSLGLWPPVLAARRGERKHNDEREQDAEADHDHQDLEQVWHG